MRVTHFTTVVWTYIAESDICVSTFSVRISRKCVARSRCDFRIYIHIYTVRNGVLITTPLLSKHVVLEHEVFGNTCGVVFLNSTRELRNTLSIQAFFMHRCIPNSFSKAILVACCSVNLGISDVRLNYKFGKYSIRNLR